MKFRKLLTILGLTAANVAHALTAPTGFEIQDFVSYGGNNLDVTGEYLGKIAVPAGWTFQKGGYYYTISPHIDRSGHYDTGLWIALMTARDNPQETFGRVIATHKKEATAVIRDIPLHDFAGYKRIGVETMSEYVASARNPFRKYHKVDLFWWKPGEMLTFATSFIAPEDEWPQAEKTYAVMRDVVLIQKSQLAGKSHQAPPKVEARH